MKLYRDDTTFNAATPTKLYQQNGNYHDQGVERNGNNAGILVTSFIVKPETRQEHDRYLHLFV